MKHFCEDIALGEPEPGRYQFTFKRVVYSATRDPIAAGVLLFGLRPRGIKFDCNSNPQSFLHFAYHTARILDLHANGDKLGPDGQRRLTLEELNHWVNLAVSLSPNDIVALEVRALVDENLGPYAYDE